MPTPTDLVTDLPADFEVFGQAVDTDFADLLGGTTGQILSKASATDLDFTWITNDVGDITNIAVTSPITGGGSSGSVTIGVNAATTSASGAVQLSDSTSTTSSVLASTPTATKAAYDLAAAAYAPAFTNNFYAGKNGLINGNFTVSQRGATITNINTDGTYTADRWYINRGGTVDYAQKTVAGGGTPPENFDAYGQYINQTAANPFITINQAIETANMVRFANKIVTVSFYARAAANTAKSKAIKAGIFTTTSDNTKPTTSLGLTTFTILYGTTASDWTRCTLTATIPSTARTIAVRLQGDPAGGFAVGDGYEITGVQLELGSTATPFQTATGFIGGELAACQRYYYRQTANTAFAPMGMGSAYSTTSVAATTTFPVTMRVTPTTLDYSTIAVYDGASTIVPSALTIATTSISPFVGLSTATVTGATQFRPYNLIAYNSATAYVGYSSEI